MTLVSKLEFVNVTIKAVKVPSTETTAGIKIDVSTVYLDEYSNPAKKEFSFCYKVNIQNKSDNTVQLLNRHWVIVDSNSQTEEVKGPGVVGKQPKLAPGDAHEYFSFCNLETDFGTMEGEYTMLDDKGNEFDVKIPRFYLSSNLNEFEANTFKRGQIVKSKSGDYTGLIVDYDMYFLNDDKIYESIKDKPPKNKPWYYLLVHDSNTVTYVSQEQLSLIEEPHEIIHPLTDFFFASFDGTRYTRNSKTWNDLKTQ